MGIKEAQAVLDSGSSVGNLGKVVDPQGLLVAEPESAVVCGHNLKVVAPQPVPKLLLVPLVPQGRGENVLGALKTILVVHAVVQGEVVGAGFGVNVFLPGAGCLDLLQRLGAAQVDKVDRRPGNLGHAYRPVGGFRLGYRRAGAGVKPGCGVSLGQGPLHQDIDHVSVLRVQADQRSVVRRLDHGFEDRVVFHHHCAAVSHEHLEAGDALSDHLVHLGTSGDPAGPG